VRKPRVIRMRRGEHGAWIVLSLGNGFLMVAITKHNLT